jgi:hypothetical protein
MKKHRSSIAICVASAALLCSSASWADDTQQPSGTTTTTTNGNGATTTTTTGATAPATTTTTGAMYSTEPGAERVPPPNMPMLITGGVLFAGAYIPSAFVAAYSSNDDDKALWAPVVGPWIDIATRDCGASCSNADTWNMIGLAASGVAQAGGLVLALASFAVPQKSGATAAATAPTKQAAAPKIQVTPMSFRAGAGIGAVGRF